MPNSTYDNNNNVPENLLTVKSRISEAANKAGRSPENIKLVAVSKNHTVELISSALLAGHRIFGENRIQETQLKWPVLIDQYPDISLHLVGSLQTNKVKDALAIFDVIETVDRPKLAQAIAREIDRSGNYPECYIEVNLGNESQKGGIFPEELEGFIALCRDDLALPICGLMCIPPSSEEPAPYFALLKKLTLRHGRLESSMGMSRDYDVAVTFGATVVRVGTEIFGERNAI